jgi:hypothetical protein
LSAASLTLPSFLIGPQAGGRSYGLLRAPTLVARSAAASDRLGDLALSLHRWSRSGEAGLVCFLPLDEGLWALIRAAGLGASELGSVALARGVILREEDLEAIDWAAHHLMAGLEAPTYALAGAPANAMETVSLARPSPTRADASGIGQLAYSLAHTDRLIETASDGEAESLLYAILDEAPRNALEGWSAGGLLHRNGRFDPAATFRLVVVSQAVAGPAPAFPRHMPARLADDRLSSADIADPKSWAAWQALFGVKAAEYRIDAESDTRLAALRWRPEFRDLSPEEVVRRQTVEASQGLDPVKPIAILHRLALAAGKLADPEIARDARRGLALAFGDIVRPDAVTAAGQIEGYLTYVHPYLEGALPAQPALLALDTGALAHLPPATVEALTTEGISRGLFDRALTFLTSGGRLSDAAAVAMLGALVRAPPARETPAYRPLLLRLVEQTLSIASKPARAASLAAIEAADLAAAPLDADRICAALWTMLAAIPAKDADYPRAVTLARRLALTARAALAAPATRPPPARLIQWAVRRAGAQARARAA